MGLATRRGSARRYTTDRPTARRQARPRVLNGRPELQAPAFEHVRSQAIDWASGWALGHDGRDRFEIEGLAAAGAWRVEAFNLLLPIALRAAGLAADLQGPRLAGSLKRRGLDRALRSLLLRVAAARGGRVPSGVGGGGRALPIGFLAELATPSTLGPSLAVAAALPPDAVRPLAADPRAHRAWRAAGHRPRALVLPLAEERAILGRMAPLFAAGWRELLAAPPRFEVAGIDLTSEALAALRPLVERSGPWLHAERAAIRRALGERRPAWLVLASDQHRLGRLAVDEARAAGVPTIVLQHGLPDSSIGYLPVVADEVAVWSVAARDWFVQGGADPVRLRVLGNPRFDRLVAADRDRLAAEVEARYGLGGRPRLLLALSPTAEHRNRRLASMAIDWLERSSEAALVVKVHPGEGRWREVREAAARSPAAGRIRVVHREPLEPLLSWADVTFLHRSTVAVESLAAGTPVVVGEIGDESVADRELRGLDLPRASDPVALGDVIARLSSAAGRAGYFEPRLEALERTCGPLDGKRAERIAEHLLGTDGALSGAGGRGVPAAP